MVQTSLDVRLGAMSLTPKELAQFYHRLAGRYRGTSTPPTRTRAKPAATIGSGQPGRITSIVGNPRLLQLVLRVEF